MTRQSASQEKKSEAARAIVLLSGGLDSYTSAALARAEGFEVYALTAAYGQRHKREIDCARRIAEKLAVKEHKIIELDLRLFGGSALTGDIAVPKEGLRASGGISSGSWPRLAARPCHPIPSSPGIPVTYVPARNTILLALALGWAEVLGSFDIFIGVNAVDYSGYPDCRGGFIEQFERLANVATAAGVEGPGRFRVHAPLIDLSKGEIIRRGAELGCDYALTHSCYDPDEQGRACGRCDACRLRLKGFAEAGMSDPIEYLEA